MYIIIIIIINTNNILTNGDPIWSVHGSPLWEVSQSLTCMVRHSVGQTPHWHLTSSGEWNKAGSLGPRYSEQARDRYLIFNAQSTTKVISRQTDNVKISYFSTLALNHTKPLYFFKNCYTLSHKRTVQFKMFTLSYTKRTVQFKTFTLSHTKELYTLKRLHWVIPKNCTF